MSKESAKNGGNSTWEVVTMQNLPSKNFFNLNLNPYPGRGLILGMDETGEYAVQVYWIMGRRDNSRNRVFGFEGDRLFTEAADPAKVEDPSLIIYNAMGRAGNAFVVSNGNQTDTAIQVCNDEGYMPLCVSLAETVYEPDPPIFTPRITGSTLITDGDCFTELALLRKSDYAGDDDCQRFYYEYESIQNGFGFCLTTYMGDGDPLPSFVGEPLVMPFAGSAQDILDTYWDALNAENRVSLAVKFIHVRTLASEILVVNRYAKVA